MGHGIANWEIVGFWFLYLRLYYSEFCSCAPIGRDLFDVKHHILHKAPCEDQQGNVCEQTQQSYQRHSITAGPELSEQYAVDAG